MHDWRHHYTVFPSAVLKWREVLRIRIIFYVTGQKIRYKKVLPRHWTGSRSQKKKDKAVSFRKWSRKIFRAVSVSSQFLVCTVTNEIAPICIDNRLRQIAFLRLHQSGQRPAFVLCWSITEIYVPNIGDWAVAKNCKSNSTKCVTQSIAELCANRSNNLMSVKVLKVLNVQSTLNFVPLLQFDESFFQPARQPVSLVGTLMPQHWDLWKVYRQQTRKLVPGGTDAALVSQETFFPDRTFTALTTLSLPGYSSLTIPSGHLPLFSSLNLIIITFPTVKVQDFPECFRLCFSLRLQRYFRGIFD